MVGAGAFYVWSPAASLAGPFLLISLALAGVVALLNAITMAQLALQHPVSGGVYHYARRYVSPRAGFLAGWMFMLGKTASAAAIALIAAQYLAPDHTRLLAAIADCRFCCREPDRASHYCSNQYWPGVHCCRGPGGTDGAIPLEDARAWSALRGQCLWCGPGGRD